MSRESFVFCVGLIVFLTPFLGLPREYKNWIVIGSGVLLMLLGYQLRRRRFLMSLLKGDERKGDAFAESIAAKPDVNEASESVS